MGENTVAVAVCPVALFATLAAKVLALSLLLRVFGGGAAVPVGAPYFSEKMAAAISDDDVQIHLALPKGHMQENVFKMLEDAGVKVRARGALRRPPLFFPHRTPPSSPPHAPHGPIPPAGVPWQQPRVPAHHPAA
jgi:hypothetical protein